jgi:hypothetical protein
VQDNSKNNASMNFDLLLELRFFSLSKLCFLDSDQLLKRQKNFFQIFKLSKVFGHTIF